MSKTMRNRVAAIEKKAYRDDEIVTLEIGDKTLAMTAGQLTQLIKDLQGTCLKPVTLREEEIAQGEEEWAD